jgi:sugar lactone lactonase YvrE
MGKIVPRMDRLSCLFLAAILSAAAFGQSYIISTAVGAGVPSNVAGKSTSLGVGVPSFLTADPAGDVYFVDQNSVVEMNASTGVLTVVAGNGATGYSGDQGPATSAQLNGPAGLALDSSGNLYIADAGNNVIREVSGGVITTIAGNGSLGAGCANGPATSAPLNTPSGLAVDSHGNLYIADTEDYCVRKVSNGTITTVAGTGVPFYSGDNGQAVNAAIGFAESVAVDSNGNLYIADAGNERIRKVTVSTGVITTVAGNGTCCAFSGDGGPATSAVLASPLGIAVDSMGNIFIADANHNVIREVTNGNINTAAGNHALGAGFSGDTGAATQAQLSSPRMVAVDGSGNLYIADQGNNRIREVSHFDINTIVGDGLIGDNGPATSGQLGSPFGIGLDPAGNLYIADTTLLRVRKVTAATGVITTVAGNGTSGASIANGSSATSVGLNFPNGVAADRNGNVYISDSFAFAILEVASGLISTFAGDGTNGYRGDSGLATQAEIGNTYGIAADSQGNVYISDDLETNTTSANRVREISGGDINTVAGDGAIGSAGDGGPATSAQLNFPTGLAVDSLGNLYIADLYNNEIRKVSQGTITTAAGNGAMGFSGDGSLAINAELNNPGGVAVDSQGNLFIADTGNNRIRMVTASDHIIRTIAGNGTVGYSGDYGPATSAELNGPTDVAVNSAGSVLVADGSSRIRVLTPPASSCGYAGVPSSLQVAAAGGSQTIAVGTTAFCPWTISGLPSWIALTGPSATTGPGNAGLTVAANSGASRLATITIADASVAVTQAGAQGAINPCDINKDGVVNVVDVNLMIQEILGEIPAVNDLKGNGIVNVLDVQIVFNAALGLGCSAKG